MKSLPQVDKVLRNPAIQAREKVMRRECLLHLIRMVLDGHRQRFFLGDKKSNSSIKAPAGEKTLSKVISANNECGAAGNIVTEDDIVSEILGLADDLVSSSLKRVINGTGVILSTNLGRAPLSPALTEKIAALLPGYSSLEIDLDNGQRGERASKVERLLCAITDCESAIVVNNNAAAVLLVMNALACNKEVIVSRGELVEIGGSFRLPDVIIAGGAKLKEIGTTNRTRIKDYEQAVNKSTGLILKCHRSNFEISGYTEDANSLQLKSLSEEKGIPFVEDLGSGALFDLAQLGLKHEPTVQESLKFADLVMFSGDKLLGGSQAGLIVGKRDLIKKLRSHPMYRALRLDKLNIALLEVLLAEYLKPDVINSLPVYKIAAITASSLKDRAEEFSTRLSPRLKLLQCAPIATQSVFGGGTTPNQTIASYGLKIGTAPGASKSLPVNKLANALRKFEPAIITLISENTVVIDLRTVEPAEDETIAAALIGIDASL